MSRCSRRCHNVRNIFTFSRRTATFQEAKNLCKQNGGTLAQNLDLFSYTALLNYCFRWSIILLNRLENVSASKCINRNSSGLRWIGSLTFGDGSPLNIAARHVNNEECLIVTI